VDVTAGGRLKPGIRYLGTFPTPSDARYSGYAHNKYGIAVVPCKAVDSYWDALESLNLSFVSR